MRIQARLAILVVALVLTACVTTSSSTRSADTALSPTTAPQARSAAPTTAASTPTAQPTVARTETPTATAAPTLRPTLAPPPTTAAPAAVPVAVNLCGAPSNPWGYNFCRGSFIASPAANICSYFNCIASFWNGVGYVMQCQDQTLSKSGGRSGSCSSHGGNSRALYSP